MKRVQKFIKLFLPLAFGVAIVWFIMQKVDGTLFMDTIRHGINWPLVFVSLWVIVLSNVLRGYRWRQQLQVAGTDPSIHDLTMSYLGNYGVNLIFPRLGEVWRCNYINNLPTKDGEKPGFVKIMGTIVSERICDILGLLPYVMLAALTQWPIALDFIHRLGIQNANAAAAAVLIPCALADSRIVNGIKAMVKNLWEGIVGLRHLPNVWSYIGWTLAVWGVYFANSWLQLYFFDFTSHYGFQCALTFFVCGSMAQIVPVQGGLGAWQIMTILALQCHGLDYDHAVTFAIVAWTLEQICNIILAGYTFLVIAIRKK